MELIFNEEYSYEQLGRYESAEQKLLYTECIARGTPLAFLNSEITMEVTSVLFLNNPDNNYEDMRRTPHGK